MHWYPNSLAQDCSIPRIAIIMLMHCPELNHRCACLLYLNKNVDTDWLILTNSLIDLMGSVDYQSTDHPELTEHLTINGWSVGRSRILLFLQYCHRYVFQCFLWLLHSWSSFHCSYWRTLTLRYADGLELKVTLGAAEMQLLTQNGMLPFFEHV